MRWLLALLLLAGPVQATEEIVSGLSQSRVSINADFVGSEILIYGAVMRTAPPPDWPLLQVIITVEGPSFPQVVRKKDHVAGIWLNRGAVLVDVAPSFYAVATTGSLSDILSATDDLRYHITIPRAIRAVGIASEAPDAVSYVEALQRIRAASGAYHVAENAVLLLQQSLFRTDVALPSDVVEGKYKVRIFLTRGRQVIDVQESQIDVRKAGLERFLFAMAQDQPLLYGLASLALALVAGWGASEVFRRLRL